MAMATPSAAAAAKATALLLLIACCFTAPATLAHPGDHDHPHSHHSVHGSGAGCKYTHGKANWDLTGLGNPQGWTIADGKVDRYDYLVNFCGDVTPPPIVAKLCANTTGAKGDIPFWSTAKSPAFQYWHDKSECHRLASPYVPAPGSKAKPATATMALMDEDNPAAGIKLTFLNGDGCGKTEGFDVRIRRDLEVNIRCSPSDTTPVPAEVDHVYEYQMCHYSFTFDSEYGCPAECPKGVVAKGDAPKVCSLHGACDWDFDTQSPRCACDEGYLGAACEHVCDEAACGGHGHCALDATKGQTHCFCDVGYHYDDSGGGEGTCKEGGAGGGSAGWVLFWLTLIGFLGLFVYHRRSHGESVNPCADVLCTQEYGYGRQHDTGGGGSNYKPPAIGSI